MIQPIKLKGIWTLPLALSVFWAGCDRSLNNNGSVSPSYKNNPAKVSNDTNYRNPSPELIKIKSKLFEYPLLQLLDRLEILRETNAQKADESLILELIKERFTPEVFPVLWEKIFKDGPDEVIVAPYSELGEFGLSDDWGRGLRLILRKQVGKHNISTILFLDYNPKTKKLEFPEDLYYERYPEYVPDAIRILIEYDKDVALGDVLNTKGKLLTDRINSKVIGISIAGKINPISNTVLDLEILPTVDNKGSVLKDQKGRQMISLVDVWSCTHCHAGGHGFLHEFPFDSQLNIHKRSGSAIAAYKDILTINPDYKFSGNRDTALDELVKKLQNPKDNLKDLLPTGFLNVLQTKAETSKRNSTVMQMYNAQ